MRTGAELPSNPFRQKEEEKCNPPPSKLGINLPKLLQRMMSDEINDAANSGYSDAKVLDVVKFGSAAVEAHDVSPDGADSAMETHDGTSDGEDSWKILEKLSMA